MQLGSLVERRARRRMAPGQIEPRLLRGRGEALARFLRRIDGVGPLPVQLHDLGAVHQALTAVGHQVRLRGAPVAQRAGPLTGPAQVEDLLAGLDHGAVDDAGDDRGQLARRDRDHRLVEQRHCLGGLAQEDQGLPSAERAEGLEVPVAEAGADLAGLAGGGVCGRRVARGEAVQRTRNQQVSLLGAVLAAVVEEPLRPAEPAPAACGLATEQECQREPEGTSGRPDGITLLQAGVVCALPGVLAVRVPADQVGDRREAFEVLDVERRLPVRRRELRVGVAPRLFGEQPAAQHHRIGPGHRIPSPGGWSVVAPGRRYRTGHRSRRVRSAATSVARLDAASFCRSRATCCSTVFGEM